MKNYFFILIQALVAFLVIPAVQAQAPPGWGWVNKLGTFVPNATSQNTVAGLGRDAAGNLYLLGNYVGTPVLSGAPTTNLGSSEIFLAKYNPAGVLLWLRTLQSTGDDGAAALTVEPSGRCTITGAFGGRTGDNLNFTGFGIQSALAGPALLGLPISGLGYNSLSFIATVDATGALLWADSPSSSYGLTASFVCRDASGNTYLSANTSPQSVLTINGQSYPAIGSYDAVLIKYNATGQIEWARRVGVPGGSGFSGEVYCDNANALYWLVGHNGTMTIDQVTVGVSSSTGAMSLVKLSSGNRVRWIKNDLLRVGSSNVVSQLVGFDAGTNSLYLSGVSFGGAFTFTGSGSPVGVAANANTTCIARCDTAGQIQWVKPFTYYANVAGGLPGTRGAAGVRGFAIRGNGFTLATSTVSYNATTYYGSSKTYGLAEAGLPCALHFNITTNQAEWVRVGGAPSILGQTTGSYLVGAVSDASDNVFVAGNFTGVAPFGTTTITSTSSNQQEIFFAKLDQTVLTTTRSGASAQPWTVFPNPTTGTVQLTGLPAQAQVRVYDALGRLMQELPAVTNSNAPRTLSGLTSGLYLLHVTHTSEVYQNQRLVVQ